MSEKKKNDHRVRYTKMVIKQAFLDLMKEYPINKITVTGVCENAEINRGTFYTYYTDVYDLMAQIENELYSEISNKVEKSLLDGTNFEILVDIFDYLLQNKKLCKILFSVNGDKEFIRRIVNIGHDNSISEWHAVVPGAKADALELHYIFISSGIVGIIQNWIEDDKMYSPVEMAEFISGLINRCIGTYQ